MFLEAAVVKTNVLKVCSWTLGNLWLTTKLTLKNNKAFKKQTAVAKLETAATCWTGAGWNYRSRPETGFGCLQRVPWRLARAARCSAGHCWEGQRPVFVSSPAPRPAALPPLPHAIYTFSLLAPLSPHFRPWSCFPLIEISLHTERTLEPEPHSERKREGQPVRNTSAKQLAHGAVKAPRVSLDGQLRSLSCMLHICVDTTVVSAACKGRFFIWLSARGTWSQCFGMFQWKSAVFPSRWTRRIRWWFGCHITENWSCCFTSHSTSLPSLVEFATFFCVFFHVSGGTARFPNWSSWPRVYSWFSSKAYYRDRFTTRTTTESSRVTPPSRVCRECVNQLGA